MTWPFGDLIPLRYQTILLDPPWYFKNYSAKGEKKNPNAHYDCMSIDELRALPVGHLAAPACALTMWSTAPFLVESIELLRHWGFEYKSMGCWAKQSSTGKKWQFGTGYGYRSACEPWLLGTLGNPKRISRSVRNLIMAPVRDHSRKPDQMRLDLERLWPGPRCELFARQRHPGWDCWGLEVDKFSASEN